MRIELIDREGLYLYLSTNHDADPPGVILECEHESDPDFSMYGLTLSDINAILPMLNAFATMYGSKAASPDVTAVALAALELDRQADAGLKGKTNADQP